MHEKIVQQQARKWIEKDEQFVTTIADSCRILYNGIHGLRV